MTTRDTKWEESLISRMKNDFTRELEGCWNGTIGGKKGEKEGQNWDSIGKMWERRRKGSYLKIFLSVTIDRSSSRSSKSVKTTRLPNDKVICIYIGYETSFSSRTTSDYLKGNWKASQLLVIQIHGLSCDLHQPNWNNRVYRKTLFMQL